MNLLRDYLETLTEKEKIRFLDAADLLNNFNITMSQSLMKSVVDVVEKKECGLQVKTKFVDRRFDLFKASEVQQKGVWFEYKCTNGLPKSGEIPQEKKTASGSLTADYQRLSIHVDHFNDIMDAYGLEIVEAPHVLKHEDGILVYEINIDVLCKATKDIYDKNGDLVASAGENIILDIKTSGLTDNAYSDYGWNTESVTEKWRIMAQPEHYIFVWTMVHGDVPPFIFTIFNPTDETDFKVLSIKLDLESVFVSHLKWIYTTTLNTARMLKTGFPALPSTKRCIPCPLRATCKHSAVIPPIETVYKATTA
jgi:hypothetical protein